MQTRRRRQPSPEGATAPSAGTRPSSAALVYATLREELVTLERRPGDPILEPEIAAAHNVSRTPVREAVLRLATEGLIEIFPKSGTFAARIPVAALPEAIVIRKALEETSARLAADRVSTSSLAHLESILECQRELSAGDNREAFHRADEAFHAGLADAAGHPGIWAVVLQVKVQVDRYRRLTLPQEGRMELVTGEHAAVLRAVKNGDGPEAAARMAAHLDRLLTDVAGFRDLNPLYFC